MGIGNVGSTGRLGITPNTGVGLRPIAGAQYAIDFTAMADGTPGAAATGQATYRDQAFTDPTQVASYIGASAYRAGKALLAPLSGDASGRSAAYTGVAMPEDVRWIYADVAWGKDGDGLALIDTMAPRLTSILASSLHIVFNRSAYAVQYFAASGAVVTVATGSFAPVPLGKMVRVGWSIEGSALALRLWTGEIVTITSGIAPVLAARNHSLIYEHIHPSAAPGLEIYRVYAGCYADPVAAGYTNLFAALNNLGNAAWTKVGLQAPVAGQADPAGGTTADKTLETATTGFHSIQQTLTKAASAKRYSVRYKVKGVGRDAAFIGLGSGFAGLSQYLGLSSGLTPTPGGTYADKAAMVYPLADGWYQVQVDFKTDAATSVAILMAASTGTTSGTANYTGDITKGLIVCDEWLYERAL